MRAGGSRERVCAGLRYPSREDCIVCRFKESSLPRELTQTPTGPRQILANPLCDSALWHSADPLYRPSLRRGILTPGCWPCSSAGTATTRKWVQLSSAAAPSLSLPFTPCASSPGQAKCKSWWLRRAWTNHCSGPRFSVLEREAVDQISRVAANLHPSSRTTSPPSSKCNRMQELNIQNS